MSFTGPFGELRKAIEHLQKISRGKVVEQVREVAAKAALEAAKGGFSSRESPAGKSWGTSLNESGQLLRSIRVVREGDGIALSASAAASPAGRSYGGGLYAGTQQYGRTIRARGTKPMRWRSPDGQWHTASKVRVKARPYLPKRGGIPPKWAEQLERAIKREMGRNGFR